MTMADEASTTGQVVTERGAAEPPSPTALLRNGGEDAKARIDVVAETLAAHGFDVRAPDWEESRRLKAMGLVVCLDVYEDHDTCEVVAEIIVTTPGRPERGQVRVSNDGAPDEGMRLRGGPQPRHRGHRRHDRHHPGRGHRGRLCPARGTGHGRRHGAGKRLMGRVSIAREPATGGRAIARVNGTVPRLAVAAGR